MGKGPEVSVVPDSFQQYHAATNTYILAKKPALFLLEAAPGDFEVVRSITNI
jgi:hypothetical protein